MVTIKEGRLRQLGFSLRSFKSAVRSENPALEEATRRSGSDLAEVVLAGLRSGDTSKLGGSFGLNVLAKVLPTPAERQAAIDGRLEVATVGSKPGLADADMALLRSLSNEAAATTIAMLLGLRDEVRDAAPTVQAMCEGMVAGAAAALPHAGLAAFVTAAGEQEAGESGTPAERGWKWMMRAASSTSLSEAVTEILKGSGATDLEAGADATSSATSPVFWFKDLFPLVVRCSTPPEQLREQVEGLVGLVMRARQLGSAIESVDGSAGSSLPPCVRDVVAEVERAGEAASAAFNAADSAMVKLGLLAGEATGSTAADATAASVGWSVFQGLRNVTVNAMRPAVERAARRLRNRHARAGAGRPAAAPAGAAVASGRRGGGSSDNRAVATAPQQRGPPMSTETLAEALRGRVRAMGNHRDAADSGDDSGSDGWQD